MNNILSVSEHSLSSYYTKVTTIIKFIWTFCTRTLKVCSHVMKFRPIFSTIKNGFHGVFTLPDTDTNTDTDNNTFHSNLCLCQYLCSVNSSADFYWTHCCQYRCRCRCLAVWMHHYGNQWWCSHLVISIRNLLGRPSNWAEFLWRAKFRYVWTDPNS